MKKIYMKPETKVIELKSQNPLLQTSTVQVRGVYNEDEYEDL